LTHFNIDEIFYLFSDMDVIAWNSKTQDVYYGKKKLKKYFYKSRLNFGRDAFKVGNKAVYLSGKDRLSTITYHLNEFEERDIIDGVQTFTIGRSRHALLVDEKINLIEFDLANKKEIQQKPISKDQKMAVTAISATSKKIYLALIKTEGVEKAFSQIEVQMYNYSLDKQASISLKSANPKSTLVN